MHAILLFWVVVASYVAAAVAAGLRDKVLNLQEVLQKEAIANGNINCPLWVGSGGW
jgi:hypothetical protein